MRAVFRWMALNVIKSQTSTASQTIVNKSANATPRRYNRTAGQTLATCPDRSQSFDIITTIRPTGAGVRVSRAQPRCDASEASSMTALTVS